MNHKLKINSKSYKNKKKKNFFLLKDHPLKFQMKIK